MVPIWGSILITQFVALYEQKLRVSWAPAYLTWSRLNKHLAPFLQWTLTGTVLGVQWRDNMLLQAVKDRYKDHFLRAHRMLYNYYDGKWWTEKPQNLTARLVSQQILLGKCYNRRKLDELPFHYYHLKENKLSESQYLNDLSWIYNKICGSNGFQLLEDIYLCADELSEHPKKSIEILSDFLEIFINILNYDGRQFYSQYYSYLSGRIMKNDITEADIAETFAVCKNPPVPSLIPANFEHATDVLTKPESPKSVFKDKMFDLVVRLPNTDQFVVSVSTDKEEICVWNVSKCERVRTLQGVSHPINLIPIDQYNCIVLCRRELRIYNLDTGMFVTKLKGVMNQKMPYYGLHDSSHLVALSRNRMYVNLMNLESGDCVTTFKAGEDRFLNSLLVSGDGRVLVCGDETQKPFPLLVWNLQSRKLLYDLRIPHHDFITSLSAITYEGNYVCCVCHEIDEPNPNFIVVYDLQSGTLFKKWKPSCDTVSLEISSQNGCVISGLEDARILVWDLITGNCRWSLQGHTAPVSLLKLDSVGSLCLSTDAQGRDKSIRVWDLNKGNLVAVYTTNRNIISCEIISKQGCCVILAIDGCKDILFLNLRESELSQETTDEVYGAVERTGAKFELSEGDASC